MNTAEFKQGTYKIMKAILENPSVCIPNLIALCSLSKNDVLTILEYIDSEGLLSGIRFTRGGQSPIPLVAYYDTAKRTEKGLNFMEAFEKTGIPVIDSEKKPTVFISYTRSDSNFVDDLASKLKTCAIVIRDTKSIKNWDSITEFMNAIRDQDFVVIVISDSYLKSVDCMYEVVQLMKEHNWVDRVMFAVIDTEVYEPNSKTNYADYWQNEYSKLCKGQEGIPPESKVELTEEIKKVKLISMQIGEFLKVVNDRNNPPIWIVIDSIVDRIRSYSLTI